MRAQILESILRKAGVPDLLEILTEKLSPGELQSVLLEVYRRRALARSPAQLLDYYQRNRFVGPAPQGPDAYAAFDSLAFSCLLPEFKALELSPVAPLGSCSAVATVHQDKVISAARHTEVVADATNLMALEAAFLRRQTLDEEPRSGRSFHLAASHRLIRAQPLDQAHPEYLPHFRVLCLVSAGRDSGGLVFETRTLLLHLENYLRLLLNERFPLCLGAEDLSIELTILDHSSSKLWHEGVLAPLARRYPGIGCRLAPERVGGRNYYRTACFKVQIRRVDGSCLEAGDGGFTDWTAQMLGSKKERLLISGLGTDLLLGMSERTAK